MHMSALGLAWQTGCEQSSWILYMNWYIVSNWDLHLMLPGFVPEIHQMHVIFTGLRYLDMMLTYNTCFFLSRSVKHSLTKH